MPLSPDGRKNLGYTRHPQDRDNTCFYCFTPLDKDYYDYVPPRDVMKDPELRAVVDVPFMYVTSCHNCKTRIYPKRYMLKTPELRREFLVSRKARPEIDEIRRQLTIEPLRPWQGYATDAYGNQTVFEIPEDQLSDTVLMLKATHVASQMAAHSASGQQTAQDDLVSGTQDALNAPEASRKVQSAQDYDLGF